MKAAALEGKTVVHINTGRFLSLGGPAGRNVIGGLGIILLSVAAAPFGWLVMLATCLVLSAVMLALQVWAHVRTRTRQILDKGVDGDLGTLLSGVLSQARATDRETALFLFEIDNHDGVTKRYGMPVAERVLRQVKGRLAASLREGDILIDLSRRRFALIPNSGAGLRLGAAIRFCNRMMAAVEEPIRVGAGNLYVTCSAGFCRSAVLPEGDTDQIIAAAEFALSEATRSGPSAIRAYSAKLKRRAGARKTLRRDAANALKNGEICAWFQPQISASTGEVTGFEALARWAHPDVGNLPPARFLETLAEEGQLELLADIMLGHALQALGHWDSAELQVPRVAINLSPEELRNPTLAERISGELDRHSLNPTRLSLEILESVIGGAEDDPCVRNIKALSAIGCGIDLDDFGTGNASIASLRQFPVERVKIDRSYVTRVDSDPDQRRMVHAIQSMAARLKIDTLAEGVETGQEYATLVQLGIGHIQGFHIARPMPLGDTVTWLRAHKEALPQWRRMTRRAS